MALIQTNKTSFSGRWEYDFCLRMFQHLDAGRGHQNFYNSSDLVLLHSLVLHPMFNDHINILTRPDVLIFRSHFGMENSRSEVFCKKGVPKKFKRLWYRCFPVNVAKFLRTGFLIEHIRWLLDISSNTILFSSIMSWVELMSKYFDVSIIKEQAWKDSKFVRIFADLVL